MTSRLTLRGGALQRAPRALRLLLALAAMAAVAAPATAATADPPFPLGVCARSTLVDPKPVCIMVDPTR